MIKTGMTVRLTFDESDGKVFTMLFGDSYREWWDQAREFCRRNKVLPSMIETCSSSWISFGGLKWCSSENFQAQLDHEGKGRKASDFKFTQSDSLLPWFLKKL
jgi:hypothetical protein